jgi:hypothetical protein
MIRREDWMMKLNNQQVARAGQHFVAAELYRRGAYTVTFAGKPLIAVFATDQHQERKVFIQVKTRQAGTWQTSTKYGQPREEPKPPERRFWVFVDLLKAGASPAYFIVPEWWIQNDIHVAHQAYLGRHGGVRARTATSTHHAIGPSRLEEWRDAWDILGIF